MMKSSRWDKNEVSCSEPEGVLYLGWHLAMFGIFLVVLTRVVTGIQWPEARAVARHLIMLLTKEKCFTPSVNSTEVEEPTLRCAFVWFIFSTGSAYPLGYTWIWSPCRVIFTQTVNQMEGRLPESSIVTARTVWVAAEQGPRLESADWRSNGISID